jgi:hypothetical protein
VPRIERPAAWVAVLDGQPMRINDFLNVSIFFFFTLKQN